MSLTVYAQMISSVVLGLGSPEQELLTEPDIADAIYAQLDFYTEGIRQSDQNLIMKWSDEFTGPADLTALTSGDAVVPLWCERLVANEWEFVETVNLDTLPQRTAAGLAAAAFHGNIPTQINVEVSDTVSTHRIAYSPLNSSIDTLATFPPNLIRLITASVTLDMSYTVINKALKYIEKRPEMAARVKGWQVMQPHLMTKQAGWMKWYEQWRKSSRGAHRAKNRTDVLFGSQERQRRYQVPVVMQDEDGGTPSTP